MRKGDSPLFHGYEIKCEKDLRRSFVLQFEIKS